MLEYSAAEVLAESTMAIKKAGALNILILTSGSSSGPSAEPRSELVGLRCRRLAS